MLLLFPYPARFTLTCVSSCTELAFRIDDLLMSTLFSYLVVNEGS